VIATQPLEDAPPVSHALAGSGELQISRGRAGSYVRRAFAASPLRLLAPRNHGTAAWVYTSSFGGGLLDGDDVRLRIAVDATATAFVSTQASTKVYRQALSNAGLPRRSARERRGAEAGASAALDACVGADGLLILAPDPIVCFARSRYRQTQRFDLEGNAGLIAIDWFTSGRHAAGERWMFERYCSRSEIRRDGEIVWHDATLLDAEDGSISARMGRFDVVATVAISGPCLHAEVTALLTEISHTPVGRMDSFVVSASSLGASGCVIRIAGLSIEEVGGVLRRHLAFVPRLLGDDPWARKW
jgi:urease accessory protein